MVKKKKKKKKNLMPVQVEARDTCSNPGSRRSPGGGHSNPLQYSCLENPTNRGTWQAIVIGSQKVGHDLINLACTQVGKHLDCSEI